MMEDVDDCAACDFGSEDLIRTRERMENERQVAHIQYQQEMQRRAAIGDIGGFEVTWRYG
jgi:hypothetical protein